MSSQSSNIFMRGLSRLSRRKKKQKNQQNALVMQQSSLDIHTPMTDPVVKSTSFSKGMERLRRSLRLRKRKDRSHDRHLSPEVTGGSKSEQWQPDEAAVRSGTCCFNVKYLGAVEVYESRGMQVCEGALRSLKAARRKPVKAVLYVSGDGLRVVDQGNSRGLLVDQTIEKVSFCAPDRMADKGFAYICRDGASRRWMCHGFLATKETGERLSHAVGCAFSICLEKKKKRDDETGTSEETTPTAPPPKSDIFNPNWEDVPAEQSNFTAQRANLAYQSFRKHVSIEERYLDPQSVIINEIPASSHSNETVSIAKPRPTSNPALFQRQGSLRAPDVPPVTGSFRRNLSLRLEKSHTRETKKLTTPLQNEPIYEHDEDPFGFGLSSSATSSSLPAKHDLDGIDLNCRVKRAPIVGPNANGSFANWPAQNIQKQFENIKINSEPSSGECTPTVGNPNFTLASHVSVGSLRTKADEWLDDVLRVSMSMSPTSSQAPPVESPQAAPRSSGPPPAHAPPPLPVKQAVSNSNNSLFYEQNNRDSPAEINWNSSPNPMKMTQIPSKPVDPFDVQWSRLAVNSSTSGSR